MRHDVEGDCNPAIRSRAAINHGNNVGMPVALAKENFVLETLPLDCGQIRLHAFERHKVTRQVFRFVHRS